MQLCYDNKSAMIIAHNPVQLDYIKNNLDRDLVVKTHVPTGF